TTGPEGPAILIGGAACAGRGGGSQSPSGLPISGARGTRRRSVQNAEQSMQLGSRRPIVGRDGERDAQLGDGAVEMAELDVDAGEIHVRIVAGFVPLRDHGL